MFIERRKISTNSVRTSGTQIEWYYSSSLPLVRTEPEGSSFFCLQTCHPSGMKAVGWVLLTLAQLVTVRSRQMRPKKSTGIRLRHRHNLFGRSSRYYIPAGFAAIWTEINDVVGCFDHVEIMFDYYQRTASFH